MNFKPLKDRVVVYVVADLDTDEAYVHYGDEDKDIVITLLHRVLEELETGAVAEPSPDGAS